MTKKSLRSLSLLALISLMVLLAMGAAIGETHAGDSGSTAALRQLPIEWKSWTEDFDKLMERRLIRVLVPFSRTLYFNDKGRERGITADAVREFEIYLNQKGKKKYNGPITVMIIPTTRDKLFSRLVEGNGDIAAGNLTITPERMKSVAFVDVLEKKHSVSEIVVTRKDSTGITSLEDLSGKTVHVRPSSSYRESLESLNARFQKEGKSAITIVNVPDELEDEDMMEMLNAGLLDIIVVDDWKARIWTQILPNVNAHSQLALRTGGKIGWAIRKDSPLLQQVIEDFFHKQIHKKGVTAYKLNQYMKRIKQVHNPKARQDLKRFEKAIALFEHYGHQYHFDPLMLVAQGYQESRLDQSARSPRGAVGIMQVLPSTGAELKVGDIQKMEPNIHAGIKYLDKLMTKYFPDVHFSDMDSPLFAFASYNAGPGKVQALRKEAARRGFDPDKWFNNVEIVAIERIGMETATYVRNIFKYYVAYRLMLETEEAAKKAREQLLP